MKVFLSWSGVIQDIKPWLSVADIHAGSRWSRQVQDELSETRFGLICLSTRQNQRGCHVWQIRTFKTTAMFAKSTLDGVKVPALQLIF